MIPQYFQTDNTALANALSLCGCQPPKDERGNPMPQLMVYNRTILERLGYKNMTLAEAVKRALKERKAGTRVFQFERTALVHRIEAAFRKAHAAMELNQDIHIEEMDPEHVAAVVYAANRLRRHMLSSFNIPAVIGSESDVSTNKTAVGAQANGKVSAIHVQ